jgi:hypothetical protein
MVYKNPPHHSKKIEKRSARANVSMMLASKLTFSIKISYLLVSRKEWRENKELPEGGKWEYAGRIWNKSTKRWLHGCYHQCLSTSFLSFSRNLKEFQDSSLNAIASSSIRSSSERKYSIVRFASVDSTTVVIGASPSLDVVNL